MENLTAKDILFFAGAITTLISLFKLVKKPFDVINSSLKKIERQNDEHKKDIESLKKDMNNHGDMIYQILDHLATDNNTGNMKRCLDAYNEYNRHN